MRTAQIFALTLLVIMFSPLVIAQQGSTLIQCGTILEAELTINDLNQNNDPAHTYTISLSAGDTITVRVQRIGDFLRFGVGILGLQSNRLTESFHSGDVAQIDVTVPANGVYTVYIWGNDETQVGVYEAFFGCTLRNGTVIAPGDVVTPDQSPTVAPSVASFSGFGFPGLAPVDFTQGVTIPFTPGTPNTGSISDGFVGIFGFTFSGNTGDVFDLSFERLSGNLNLGLAVLSEQNEIAFQASLVTSSSLSTRFTLPSTGGYTIGVFRIELLPPAAPEATTFQITGAINP
jgi:hypothetical protein